MEGGDALLPFLSQFEGVVHEIPQGEGDAFMPALFSLGQHSALEAIQARRLPGTAGRSPHDPQETSIGGGSDFARVVSAMCCRIPHCCCSSGLDTVGLRSASCGFRSGGPPDWHARPGRQQQIPCSHTSWRLSGATFSCFPTNALARFNSAPFFSWPSLATRAVCAEVWCWVVGVFALESVAARVCHEAGATVGTDMLVRDLNFVLQGHPDSVDSRWLLTDVRCFTGHNLLLGRFDRAKLVVLVYGVGGRLRRRRQVRQGKITSLPEARGGGRCDGPHSIDCRSGWRAPVLPRCHEPLRIIRVVFQVFVDVKKSGCRV